MGIRAAGQSPPPVCLVVMGLGVTAGPVAVEHTGICGQDTASGGWAAGAVPLLSVITRDSRQGCRRPPCLSSPGLLGLASCSALPLRPPEVAGEVGSRWRDELRWQVGAPAPGAMPVAR